MKFIAVLLLFLLWPILLLIPIVIFFDSGLPIFYKDRRYGKDFKKFDLFKYRTMNNSKDGIPITANDDKRVTRFGKLLRRLKLDEIPQLINIIKGEINFVGYRPESTKIVDNNFKMFKDVAKYKPGLTDLSSIVFKDESSLLSLENPMDFYQKKILPVKLNLNRFSIKKNSFLFRLLIVIITLVSLLNYSLSIKMLNYIIPKKDFMLKKQINDLFKVELFK